MDDAKFVFMTDSKEKKRIAQGDRKRVRSTRKCTLPFEMMTGKERKAYMAPSEVEVFSLRPMTLAEYKAFEKDKQEELLKWYGEKYGWNAAGIAAALDVAYITGKKVLEESGLTSYFKMKMNGVTKEQKEIFIKNRLEIQRKEAVESDNQEENTQPHPEAENPVQMVLEAQNSVYTVQLHAAKECKPLQRQLHGIANSLEDGKIYRVVLSIAEVAAVSEAKKSESDVVDA